MLRAIRFLSIGEYRKLWLTWIERARVLLFLSFSFFFLFLSVLAKVAREAVDEKGRRRRREKKGEPCPRDLAREILMEFRVTSLFPLLRADGDQGARFSGGR